jgi:glutaredoxin 3
MGNLLDKYQQSFEKKFVDKEIQDNCIVVFAKSTCPYSQMAKEVFDKYKVPYKAIDIDFRLDEAQLQEELGRRTTARTVGLLIH